MLTIGNSLYFEITYRGFTIAQDAEQLTTKDMTIKYHDIEIKISLVEVAILILLLF
jgi:hypothetical protein